MAVLLFWLQRPTRPLAMSCLSMCSSNPHSLSPRWLAVPGHPGSCHRVHHDREGENGTGVEERDRELVHGGIL